jgi:uncharacterized protein (TIGR00255 family)
MTLRSMTGFGRSSGPVGTRLAGEVSARSVNSRFLDLTIKTRESELELEPLLRKVFGRHLTRGKVEVHLRLRRVVASQPVVQVDEGLLQALLTRLATLSAKFPIDGRLSARDLMAIPEVVTVEATAESFSAEETRALEALADEAARALVAMREAEGAAIASDLLPRIAFLREKASLLEARREEIARQLAETLVERVHALFPDTAIDPVRLAQEAALAADRADVSEELQRLRGHLDQFEGLLSRNAGPAGKTLDFLAQEILRELNTLGAKSRDLRSTREVLEMKSETEKVREQVQNIE